MTEVRANVGFPNLTPPNSVYVPKQCLFRKPSIMLHGKWTAESVHAVLHGSSAETWIPPCSH